MSSPAQNYRSPVLDYPEFARWHKLDRKLRAASIESTWRTIARPNQIAPAGDWRVWLIQAGRGFGKTRVGAEWVCEQILAGKKRLALIGPTAADCRDVMVEGESGIMAVCTGQ